MHFAASRPSNSALQFPHAMPFSRRARGRFRASRGRSGSRFPTRITCPCRNIPTAWALPAHEEGIWIMRASMAFFAGVGTVIVAVAAGLGGGLTIANIMSPQAPKQELSKVERRGSTEPSASTKDPLVPVPYMAATQASSNGPVVVSTAAQNAQSAHSEANASSAQATPAPTQVPQAQVPEAKVPEITASNDQAAVAPDPAKSGASRTAETSQPETSKPETSKTLDTSKSSEVSKPSESSTAKPSSSAMQPAAVRDQPATPDNAYAKARNADAKQAERRRADRHQQWADRRRYQPSREQELRDVEAKVREATETRDDVERPTRVEYPQVRVFGAE
jgi:hypothetical protein